MKKLTSVFCTVLILALLAAPLSACGAQDGKAVSVWLARTQGSVSVWDESEKSLAPLADLGLYDGYRMSTAEQSYGWLSLDKERLAKLDAQSEMAVTRAGRQLELTVNAGSLFFNIETPLESDETLDIRTSNMMVGIRGTCGWVSVTPAGTLCVCLLEGAVECTVTPENGESVTQTVHAGEQGALFPDGGILVTPLCREDVPDFVLEELTQEPELAETLPARADAAEPADTGASGDSAYGLDPTAPYAQTLAAMPVSDGTSLGLLLAERLDFDADGDPELMVITVEEPRYVPEELIGRGPYIAVTFYRGDFISEDSEVAATYKTLLPGESISLSSAPDGRLLIMTHEVTGNDGVYCNSYFGPSVRYDWGWLWGPILSAHYLPLMDEYLIIDYGDGSGAGTETQISAAEYTNPFTDLRVLVSNGG